MGVLSVLKSKLGNMFSVVQDYSRLSDQQLMLGYLDTKEYIERVEEGLEETMDKRVSTEEALKSYHKSLSTLASELKKRGIDPNSISQEYVSGEGRRAICEHSAQ